MVGDDDVDAEFVGAPHHFRGANAGIHADDQLHALLGGGLHHFGAHAVAVLQAVRHVIRGRRRRPVRWPWSGARRWWCRPRRSRRRSGSSRRRGWRARCARWRPACRACVSGSCRSSKAGRRKRRAAAGSANPRRDQHLARPAGRLQRGGQRGDSRGVGRGKQPARRPARTNSWRNSRQAESPSSSIVVGHGAGDLVLDAQELLVPVGLQFVDVEAGMVVEGQFQRAGHAFVDAQLAQARFVVALLVAVDVAVLELRQQVVDVARPRIRGWRTGSA